MKKVLILIIVVFSSILWANVRGPAEYRGSVSSSLSKAFGAVKLVREDMIVKLPALNQNNFKTPADVIVKYSLVNRGASSSIPVSFLALGVQDAEILLNGKKISYKKILNHNLVGEYLLMLFKNRYKDRYKHRMFFYRIGYYETYFSNKSFMKNEKKMIKKPFQGNSEDYKIFARMVKKDAMRIYKRLRFRMKMQKFSSLAFTLKLAKGKSSLVVKYRQRLDFNERSAGSYFRSGINLNTAQWNFRYLLYPALSWKGSSSMKYNLTVIMPRIFHKGMIWNSHYKTAYKSNLVFQKKYYNKKSKITVLKSSFSGLPAKVFDFTFYKKR